MRDEDVPALEAAISGLWDLAREQGLDPLPVHFEFVPSEVLYEVAAYGLPGRFSHWSLGKAYHMMKSQYDLGLVKCFELVVNASPAQALLLDTNDLLTNKLVAAHVLGHADFFHHNAHFAAVDRGVADRVDLHAARLRDYAFQNGRDAVEAFLDVALAVEDHVDPRAGQPVAAPERPAAGGVREMSAGSSDLAAGLLPPSAVEPDEAPASAPDESGDLLLFLMQHAPQLETWQRDVLAMVRAEALYFRPQLRTKVSNEGWATLWHTRLMRSLGLADDEYLDFARMGAAVRGAAPGNLNPYALGAAIYEDILARLGEQEGLRQIFLIREVEDDLAFVRNHLTQEVAERLDLFTYALQPPGPPGQPRQWRVTSTGFEDVRTALLRELESAGRPVVVAADADFGGRRELLLRHRHDGRDLQTAEAEKTLSGLASLWGRRCSLETVVGGRPRTLVADPPANVPWRARRRAG